MSVITIAKPPVTDLAQLQAVIEAACRPDEPAGLLARFAGPADDGTLRVVAAWESREHAMQFFAERLGPAVATLMGPEPAGLPEATWVEVRDEVSYARDSLQA